MLEDTLKNTRQEAFFVDNNSISNVSSTIIRKESKETSKPVARSLAKDVLAILALKPELFF